MKFKLHVWRQASAKEKGQMKAYTLEDVSEDSSFLEMMDQLNEQLVGQGQEPVAFDHDCREGVCGSCAMMINGQAHGPLGGATTCQLYMRSFKDGQDIYIEPWRAKAFPMVKDLVVDRSAFDRVIQKGGFISVTTGGVPDGNDIPIPKEVAAKALDAAECIGCGACVAQCKNSSAMLFVGAKASHLGTLPQGQPEKLARIQNMVEQMDKEGFGNCTNQYECEAVCPKHIDAQVIRELNAGFIHGTARNAKS